MSEYHGGEELPRATLDEEPNSKFNTNIIKLIKKIYYQMNKHRSSRKCRDIGVQTAQTEATVLL